MIVALSFALLAAALILSTMTIVRVSRRLDAHVDWTGRFADATRDVLFEYNRNLDRLEAGEQPLRPLAGVDRDPPPRWRP